MWFRFEQRLIPESWVMSISEFEDGERCEVLIREVPVIGAPASTWTTVVNLPLSTIIERIDVNYSHIIDLRDSDAEVQWTKQQVDRQLAVLRDTAQYVVDALNAPSPSDEDNL